MSTSKIQFDNFESSYSNRMQSMRSSAVRDLFAAASRSDIISLSGGMPDISVLPLDQVAKAASDSIKEEGLQALQYGSTNGRVQTRQLVCDLVKDFFIKAKPEDVIITSGAQQALDLIGKVFINPGDTILVEAPTYLGALQAFSAYEPNIVSVEMDHSGLIIEELEATLEKLGRASKPKFLYTIPSFQNPTGVSLTVERRHKLVDVCAKYNVVIIEDNPYGRIHFNDEVLPTLKSLDNNVVYLGTVSKVFAPGLRCGCIIAPPGILAKINLAKQGGDLCGSAMCQVMVEHYFHDTDWRGTMKKIIPVYEERKNAILNALDKYFPPEASWTKPEGGLFIWVMLPSFINTDELLNVALDNGVTFAPGSGFYPGGHAKSSFRMAFCFEEPKNLDIAVKRLADVINERLDLYRAFVKAGVLKE
ncbi:MAG: PLP-dependent aminotransferase family protein [Coriobacteriales bacterium]|nr:PLP-dependent aminotransferase family protein [Coriobacteriales bacterium]